MLLSYFTEDAYERLYHEINYNIAKYAQQKEWLDDYFANENYFKTSKTVDVIRFNPTYSTGKKTDAQKSEEDLINTRNLFEAYKKLTPLQASNKYMWTYLCHAVPDYRKYIINRWLEDQRENTIKTRFFVSENNSRSSLFDNALSRLWWFGYLTYDIENRANPFALTSVLLLNQTICTDFIDTKNSMNPRRAKGVLLALKEFKEIVNDNEGITEYFRTCNKYLNRYAAITNLDFLEVDEIKKITLDYMISLRDEVKKSKLKT